MLSMRASDEVGILAISDQIECLFVAIQYHLEMAYIIKYQRQHQNREL